MYAGKFRIQRDVEGFLNGRQAWENPPSMKLRRTKGERFEI